MECDELLYGKSFLLNLKGVVYKSYLRLAFLCDIGENDIGIFEASA